MFRRFRFFNDNYAEAFAIIISIVMLFNLKLEEFFTFYSIIILSLLTVKFFGIYLLIIEINKSMEKEEKEDIKDKIYKNIIIILFVLFLLIFLIFTKKVVLKEWNISKTFFEAIFDRLINYK